MQNHYSLLYREDEREMFPTLKVRSLRVASDHSSDPAHDLTMQMFGVGSIPWSPLGRGLLTLSQAVESTRHRAGRRR